MNMTNKEWNKGIEFLQNAEEGMWLEHDGRVVIVDNMTAGNFRCYDDDHEFVKLVETAGEAMMFLARID